jgi:diguanylate cyclase (GGDEF)-like protein
MDKFRVDKLIKQNRFLERTAINFLFLIAVIFVIVLNTVCYIQIKKFDAANKWLIHTYQVIRANNNILTGLLGAESLVRGYAITKDQRFLSTLQSKIDCINEGYNTAKQLTSDNSIQQERFMTLKPLIDKRIADLQYLMSLPRNLSNEKKVADAILAQQLSEQIQTMLSDIDKIEFLLLKERSQKVLDYFSEISMLTLFSGTVSMILLIAGLVMVNYQQTRQINAEKNTKKADIILKGIINGTVDQIAAIDPNFNLIAFNQVYEREFKRIYGKRVSLEMNLKEIIESLPDDKNKLISNWERALTGEEFTEIMEAGDKRFALEQFEISYYGLYDIEGELIGASQIIRNIKKRLEAEKAKKIASEKLEQAFKELKQHSQELSLINEMDNVLQTCVSINETLVIIKNYGAKLFPNTAGILYLMNSSHKFLEAQIEWNEPNLKEKVFTPDECWGLRQLKVYVFKNAGENILCKHNAKDRDLNSYICAPLLSSNEVIGLLYIEIKDENKIDEEGVNYVEKYELVVNNVSSQLALALSNIRLRDTLKNRSLHDPLTGLYNRYYLEDTLEKDLIQSKQTKTTLAVVMMDIDHFKSINDQFGHEAGDIVLVEIAKLLQEEAMRGEIICRYGGEEFLFLLFDISKEMVFERMENLRKRIAEMQYSLTGIKIDAVTVSFGIAMFPEHAMDSGNLINAADYALYESKRQGRNKVTIYQSFDS